jgi:hypothetical protein
MKLGSLVAVALLLLDFHGACLSEAATRRFDNELRIADDWQFPTRVSIVADLETWMEQANIPAARIQQISKFMETQFTEDSTEVLDIVFSALEIARPELAEARQQLMNQRTVTQIPELSHWIDGPHEAPFLRDTVRLYFARWLAQNKFYDESLAHLQKLDLNTISDPMSLLFYRGLMEHQLLKQEACVNSMELLLQHEDRLPRRFAVLAKLMLADIRPLETDSLNEIARLMDDIQRRTELHRSGRIVLDQERSVIQKLDKLIEGLEAQQAQAQPGGGPSSKPLQDSQRTAGKGSGEVTHQKQSDGGDWGNLPPAQRGPAIACAASPSFA